MTKQSKLTPLLLAVQRKTTSYCKKFQKIKQNIRLIKSKPAARAYFRVSNEFIQQLEAINEQVATKRQQFKRELTTARFPQFRQFPADESLVGDQCGVCLDDIEVGRRMMRLDCNCQHVFCQDCVEGWFCDHNTCPNCMHIF